MRSLAIHAALALLGLALAYQTWTRPAVVDEKPSEEVVLLACKPEQLESIALDMPTHHVVVRPDKAAKAYWFTSTPAAAKAADKSAESAPDAGAPADEEKPELKGVRTTDASKPVTFRGSRAAEALIEYLVPVRALRDLGRLDPARDADFGFDKAGTTYTVQCGGQTMVFTVAGRTYGNNDHYVRDQKSGKTYLMLGKPFTDLQAAQFTLVQNELQTFALADVDEAVVRAGERSRRLVQRDRALKGLASWVAADKPDQRNEVFGNWLERVAKLRARSYLPRDVEPGGELQGSSFRTTPVMTLEYKLAGAPRGNLELIAVEGERGERYFYARSGITGTWVMLFGSAAKEIEADIPLVVGEAASAAPPGEKGAAEQPE